MFNHFRNQFAVKATYFQELLRSMARNSRRTSLSRETLAEFQVAKSSKENQTNFKKHFLRSGFRDTGISLCALARQDSDELHMLDRVNRRISWSGEAIPSLGTILGACRTTAAASAASSSTFPLPSLVLACSPTPTHIKVGGRKAGRALCSIGGQ